jgi:DNA-binding CsgD family transcriptional regulator
VRGTRRFNVDPRRRQGKSGGARKMLAADGEVVAGRHSGWSGLVSALQRHTVHGELAQLSKDDRQILSLAYLSGHTNREIATMLQVSVSTVSRRLSGALERLEESMRKAGVWIASLLLLALAAYSRLAQLARTNRWPTTVAALVAAGTATTVAVTIAVTPPVTSGVRSASVPATVHTLGVIPTGDAERPDAVVVSSQPVTVALSQITPAKHVDLKHAVVALSRICRGNPTSAPPAVPVGPRGGLHGPPVTHPGPGGCGHSKK